MGPSHEDVPSAHAGQLVLRPLSRSCQNWAGEGHSCRQVALGLPLSNPGLTARSSPAERVRTCTAHRKTVKASQKQMQTGISSLQCARKSIQGCKNVMGKDEFGKAVSAF